MAELIIPSKDGKEFSAYVAMPAQTPAPVVVVIQEIFGVNAGIREKCDWLASEGFIAVAPDLFWRLEPGIQLTDRTDAEWAQAFDLFNRFDVDQGIEDLRDTRHVFMGHAESNGKVGCLGFCLGGKMAFLLACRTRSDASVGYYGVGLDELTGEAEKIKKPVLLHIAEEDEYVSKDAQRVIKDALAGNEHVTIRSYPGTNHAFTRQGGGHYDETAAQEADAATLAFLRKNLR